MENRPPLLILYGTQTGCAQEVAERIGREGKYRHFKTRVCSLEDYDRVRNYFSFTLLFYVVIIIIYLLLYLEQIAC